MSSENSVVSAVFSDPEKFIDVDENKNLIRIIFSDLLEVNINVETDELIVVKAPKGITVENLLKDLVDNQNHLLQISKIYWKGFIHGALSMM